MNCFKIVKFGLPYLIFIFILLFFFSFFKNNTLLTINCYFTYHKSIWSRGLDPAMILLGQTQIKSFVSVRALYTLCILFGLLQFLMADLDNETFSEDLAFDFCGLRCSCH